MKKSEAIKYLLSKKETRNILLEKDLFLFGLYYFPEAFKYPSADFHKQWAKDMMTDKNVLLIGFRESAKTFWAFVKFVHNICYKKKRFQMFYCFDQNKAGNRMYDVVVALQSNLRIRSDFWALFPEEREPNKAQKRTISEFITKNGIKCKAMSIWASPRGEVYISSDGTFRPDAVFLDDIDVDKSVASVFQIEKNYLWIKGEFLGGLSGDSQIIFLGNVIKTDGIVLRFEIDYKNSPYWIIRRKAIIENGTITWARFSQEDIDKKRSEFGEISFNQNMLLIPYSGGEAIVKRENILYNTMDDWDRIIIGVDPAISEKALSDFFGITVTAHKGKHKNVKACYALKGKEKDPYWAVQFLRKLYDKWQASCIVVETVAFQQIFARLLKDAGMATREIQPHRDKVTRAMEKQSEFEQWFISFDPDGEGIKELVEEWLMFPNVIHDDRVDSCIYSFEPARKVFVGSL